MNPQHIVYVGLGLVALVFTTIAVNNYYSEPLVNNSVEYWMIVNLENQSPRYTVDLLDVYEEYDCESYDLSTCSYLESDSDPVSLTDSLTDAELVFNAVKSGNMLARALISPTITLASGETLQIDYDIVFNNS